MPNCVHSAANIESMSPRYGSSTSSSARFELVGSGFSTGTLTTANFIDRLGLGRDPVPCNPTSQNADDSSDAKYYCTVPSHTAGPSY